MADEFLLEAIKYNSGLVMVILIFTAMYIGCSVVDVILSIKNKYRKK